jgi:hypothetical protein
MRHAGAETFGQLEGLLADLRAIPGLNEKKTGVFYRRSRAFLHFHEDPTGPYADVRLRENEDFVRFRVRTATDQKRLLRAIRGSEPTLPG